MEVFMDDFMVYVDSFEACLENLSKVLKRCVDTNLVLNFEKCHFIVTKGIVLGHLISNRGIEVDKSKIDIISSLSNPTSELKSRLTSAPILQAPNWDPPFELMCDASNSALGAVLGQRDRVGQPVHIIAYASRTMDPAQQNYTTTEKELLAIVFALDEFCSYLLEIRDKKGVENFVADHLSRIEKESEPMPILDEFPDKQLLSITTPTPWFADIYNFVAASRCILKSEINSALQFCHSVPGGGHHGSTRTARKVLDSGLYWPNIFRDAHQFVFTCATCQKVGRL
ncbi:Retrovirus-related Pol polyprotein from transposon 17.6, partial [Mucuna pruriens]